MIDGYSVTFISVVIAVVILLLSIVWRIEGDD